MREFKSNIDTTQSCVPAAVDFSSFLRFFKDLKIAKRNLKVSANHFLKKINTDV